MRPAAALHDAGWACRPLPDAAPDPSKLAPPTAKKGKRTHRYTVECWSPAWRIWRYKRPGRWVGCGGFDRLHDAQAAMHRERNKRPWKSGKNHDQEQVVRVVDTQTHTVSMGLPWPLPHWARLVPTPTT